MTPTIYVNVYIGQTRAAGWIRTLESYGLGEMCVREEFPPRRNPWAFDNGAFKDWNKTSPMKPEEFNDKKYQGALDHLWLHGKTNPDFIVVPDLPMGGMDSLKFSESWLPRLRGFKVPLYLVVQDGITEAEVAGAIQPFGGLFVGGSQEWKLKTARDWIELAHDYGRKCHIGRMGTETKVRAALRWGADSIDSSLPLWSADNLARFLRGFRPTGTLDMPLGVP
jgi:hypothetical protein